MSDKAALSGPLQILAYCPAAAPGAAGRVGSVDYSYAFVLERFRPVLQTLGDLVETHSVSELQRRLATTHIGARVLLSFAPVHRTPVGLAVATVPVFAWEFPNLPRWSEGGHYHDWAWTLAQCQGAVTLSQHTCEAVRAETTLPVWAIPAPIYDRFAQLPPAPLKKVVRLTGRIIDSEQLYDLEDLSECEWDGKAHMLEFGGDHLDSGRLVGFHGPEDWGRWSAGHRANVVLPFPVEGRVRLAVECVGFGSNAGHTVAVSAGDAHGSLTLPASPQTVEVALDVKRPSAVLTFSGLVPSRQGEGREDRRRLGMGLIRLEIRRARSWRDLVRPRPRHQSAGVVTSHAIRVGGVVYCSVLNPADGRKNWRAIVTAFCAAFRDEPNATLVLKMTHRSVATFVGPLLLALRESMPFRCRVIALHGYMLDDELAGLADAADFYVNASTGEGLCMPLMEFMSRGVPAVAPRHSAMTDYLTDDNSIALQWSEYPTCWPQDPSLRWRTRNYHVHWDSLRDQYRRSHELAVQQPGEYSRMRVGAARALQNFSGDERVRGQLQAALQAVAGAKP